MRPLLQTLASLFATVALAACGSGTAVPTDGDVGGSTTPYTLEWTGTVKTILDLEDENASMANLEVGDAYVASLTFDPAEFAEGEVGPGDLMRYAAPPGLEVVYEFASGLVVEREVLRINVEPGESAEIESTTGERLFIAWQVMPGPILEEIDPNTVPFMETFTSDNSSLNGGAFELTFPGIDRSVGPVIDYFKTTKN